MQRKRERMRGLRAARVAALPPPSPRRRRMTRFRLPYDYLDAEETGQTRMDYCTMLRPLYLRREMVFLPEWIFAWSK